MSTTSDVSLGLSEVDWTKTVIELCRRVVLGLLMHVNTKLFGSFPSGCATCLAYHICDHLHSIMALIVANRGFRVEVRHIKEWNQFSIPMAA